MFPEDADWIESHSLDAFKRIWKLNKLDHVWMLRNEKEDFNDFFSELSIYVVGDHLKNEIFFP